jgi:D-threo-aldose 1-dehydrogenase
VENGTAMATRTIRDHLDVTQLGFGAAQLGNLSRAISDAEASATVDAAWAAGIRYFDTAPHYGLGLSERRLGDALAGRPRDEFVVSTKVGRLLAPSPATAHERDSEGFDVPADMRRVWDFSRDGVRRSIDASLQRMGLDRLDIVYVHDPDDFAEQAITEAIPALIALRDEGVIGAVGLGMNQTAVPTEAIRRTDVDVVMCANRYTLLDQSALDDLLPLAMERGVAIVAAAVYNSGLLATARPAAGAMYEYAPAPAALIERANALADACEAEGVTLPAAAVQYPLRHPAVVSVVLGMRSPDQVADSLARGSRQLPESLWERLSASGLVRPTPVDGAP